MALVPNVFAAKLVAGGVTKTTVEAARVFADGFYSFIFTAQIGVYTLNGAYLNSPATAGAKEAFVAALSAAFQGKDAVTTCLGIEQAIIAFFTAAPITSLFAPPPPPGVSAVVPGVLLSTILVPMTPVPTPETATAMLQVATGIYLWMTNGSGLRGQVGPSQLPFF